MPLMKPSLVRQQSSPSRPARCIACFHASDEAFTRATLAPQNQVPQGPRSGLPLTSDSGGASARPRSHDHPDASDPCPPPLPG